MIHVQDTESLQRLTGLANIPEKIEREYDIRIKMFHADGNSGPLGTVGLIDMVRFLGYTRPNAEAANPIVDWRRFPQDGSLRVEAKFFGSWLPGSFRGFVSDGLLAIKLDSEDFVKECRKDMVRVAESQVPPPGEESQPLQTDHKTDNLSVIAPEAEFDDEDDEDELPRTNWAAVEAGESVYIDENGSTAEGAFIRLGAEGPEGQQLLIQVDGEESPREILESCVIYAGEPRSLAEVKT